MDKPRALNMDELIEINQLEKNSRYELIEMLGEYFESAGFTDGKRKELQNKTKRDLQELYVMHIYEEDDGIPF